MWRARWDPGVLKAEALALLPCGLGMAFSQSHVMAARRHQHSRLLVEVDEYSSNPTQAFTFYNINQGRFQPPHVQMVDPVPHDAPKPPGYTRFVCVSDTHSRTDPIQMPYGDVLIHAGDFTELGLPSEVKKFNEWLGSLPYEYKIVIAGNHELTFDQEFMADLIKQDFYYFPSVSKLKPENYENVQSLLTNCIYLQDSEVTVRGFRIYGSPWQPWFYGWGFNLPRGQALLEKWNLIPEGVDILITHGPPLGFLDWVPKKMQRVGCVELLNTVQRRVQPRLHVFGHIHEGYWRHGRWDDHLCECICVHRELPTCESTHSHRPPHTPELLTAPAAPALPTRISSTCLAESTDPQPPFLPCRQPVRLGTSPADGLRPWNEEDHLRLVSLLSSGVRPLRVPSRGSALIANFCVYIPCVPC
ncbi:metallophosphoesterase domain-containing protein 1 isoform X1 [Camelus ferus]|uniref:Metallophosphoesterase domain-containing protein 1 isoform X1 n=1 Tax=Camelus ferus TaxID=419612 RepID=A0A8B6YCS1_CAMFR|nr:metallophosphoesterase domain-containing protein 1 isoform X1 [Camelus ferus]